MRRQLLENPAHSHNYSSIDEWCGVSIGKTIRFITSAWCGWHRHSQWGGRPISCGAIVCCNPPHNFTQYVYIVVIEWWWWATAHPPRPTHTHIAATVFVATLNADTAETGTSFDMSAVEVISVRLQYPFRHQTELNTERERERDTYYLLARLISLLRANRKKTEQLQELKQNRRKKNAMTDLSIQNLLPSSISCLTTTESATYNTHCQTLLLLLLQHVEVVLFEGVARCWFREQCYTHTHSALVYRHKQHPGIILPERLRRPFPVFCIFLLDIIFFFFSFFRCF